MEFVGYEKCYTFMWKKVKFAEIQRQSANKVLQKLMSTIHLLRQHWVLIVTNIRTIVISFQKIWICADCSYIHQK